MDPFLIALFESIVGGFKGKKNVCFWSILVGFLSPNTVAGYSMDEDYMDDMDYAYEQQRKKLSPTSTGVS